ncbi:hypothetical protein [Rhizobium alvei]|uniref:Sulfotransferase family protein n=1 Tax=Rhizobium alvei TaxID=1132659 RepID=A0ABT8YGB9_9HYPH|nr:hypothetical protein [Rhizobium alvei]MDO6962698.1 hypothetical protein [Rhizobium alvei]
MTRSVLHIGAHKTATTYMQAKLALNVDLLAERGIRYDPLAKFRKNFTSILNDPELREKAYLKRLRASISSQDVIMSDENMLGSPGNLVRSGVFYAQAKTRIRKVCRLTGVVNPEIFLALRDYAGFVVSMYSEYIRHREFMKFADFLELYQKSEFSWLTVISDVVEAAPTARLFLWDFSSFRTLENTIFSQMIGFDASELQTPDGPVRESFSAPAMDVFETLAEILPAEEVRKTIGPVSRILPKGDLYKAFDPLSADMTASLKDAYRKDLEEISVRFPNVVFIK